MALSAGDAECTTGLAQRLYDARVTTITLPPAGAMRDACVAALKADCHAIAVAVVAALTTDAEVSVEVSVGGLQSTTLTGDPTDPPPAPVTLTGSIA